MSAPINREPSDQIPASLSSAAQTGLPKALKQAILLVSLPLGILGFILPVYGTDFYANGIVLALSVLVLWVFLRVSSNSPNQKVPAVLVE